MAAAPEVVSAEWLPNSELMAKLVYSHAEGCELPVIVVAVLQPRSLEPLRPAP